MLVQLKYTIETRTRAIQCKMTMLNLLWFSVEMVRYEGFFTSYLFFGHFRETGKESGKVLRC